MLIFRHPKYYKELRKRNKEAGLSVEVSKASSEISLTSNRLKSDQAISGADSTEKVERAPGQGLKQQGSGSSHKQQAEEAQATETQASSSKR